MIDDDENPFAHPMVEAIGANDILRVEELLKKGIKLNYQYAFTGFGPNKTHPEILELLAKYNALPKDTSLATLKLVLFAMGNTQIKLEEFWDKPDLNLNGFPERPAPMDSFVRDGNTRMVHELIHKGVTSRPVSSISCHPSHFMGCNYLEIDEFKQRIENNLAGNNRFLNYEDFSSRSKTIMLLLAHPTQDLEKNIERETSNTKYREHAYLPFFAWAAANNKTESLDNIYFRRLFSAYSESSKEAAVIAAVFSSKEFLLKAYKAELLNKQDITKACAIAAAQGDNQLLEALVPLLQEKTDLPFFQTTRKVSGSYFMESSSSPLFWAIRNSHPDTVDVLLQLGISANGIADKVSNETYLQAAAKMNEIEAVRLLLDAGADLNHTNVLGETVFDDAKDNEEVMQLLLEKKAQSNVDVEKELKNENSIINQEDEDEDEDESEPFTSIKYV